MAETPDQSADTPSEQSGFDRRQFLAASGVVGGSFLAGAGTTAVLSDCITPLGGGGDPVKIGAVYQQSGNARSVGRGTVPAAKLAVQEVNDAGGIDGRDVELQVRDHGPDPATTIEDLVEGFGADVVLGLTSSAVALDAGPTLESLGVPVVLTDVGTPFVTEWDTETYGDYYASERGMAAATPNVFRTNANTSTNTYALARFARENLDVTRVATLGPASVYGRQAWDYFRAYSNGLGADYEYVAAEFSPSGADDMTPHIDAVLAADPDLVFTSFWAGDAVTFVRQAVERGLFDRTEDVLDTLGADPRVFEALGDTMPEGVHYATWYWHSAFDNAANDRFLEAWRTTYELAYRVAAEENVVDIPPFAGGSTWAAVLLYRQAVEAVGGTDPQRVIAALEGATLREDPRGPTTIGAESHQATAPTVVGETSTDDDVPYDGVGLEPTDTYTLDRSTARRLLAESGLAPGV